TQAATRAATQAGAASSSSSDCAYAAQLKKVVDNFGNASQKTSVSPGSVTSLADVGKLVDPLITASNNAVSDLKKITPPNDFKQFHADLITAFQGISNNFQDAKKAVTSGNLQQATDALSKGEANTEDSLGNLDKKYPDLSKRIDACP